MATLENNIDTVPCRHCGSPVRPGMIRCRECRGLLVETEDEFTLAPKIAAMAKAKCPRCQTPLEPGIDDCPKCASALLDDLLKGPEEEPVARPFTNSGWIAPPLSNADVRPREAGGSSAERAEFIPLREVPSPAAAQPEPSIDDAPPGLFGDDDEPSAPAAPVAPQQPTPKKREGSSAGNKSSAGKRRSGAKSAEKEVETSAACAALLASLATAASDANLRVEIATALGKLGDKEAMAPLERHMTDGDIRVRRAVATALVQLGHPKGQSLLEIAERRPAAATLTMAKGTTVVKPKRSGGSMDSDTLKKVGVGVIAIGLIAGGAWFFLGGKSGSAGSRTKKTKSKTKSSKKTSAISPRLKFEFKYS
ncbi:MAG: HEAT repeat domain-containing protein [Planctomycetes bacterium]|nr:HEAT repeat domain-containing protein [Planctomycetota bacterium]